MKRKLKEKDSPNIVKKKRKESDTEDFFKKHICWDADEEFIKNLQGKLQLTKKDTIEIPAFSEFHCSISRRSGEKYSFEAEDFDLRRFGVSAKLCTNYEALMLKRGDARAAWLSASLYQIIGRYMDLSFVTKDECYTELFCLHALNHVMRTRKLVMANKNTLETLKEQEGSVDDAQIEACRDQGLARPKVLILCPFRKNAFEIVNKLISLMFGSDEKPFVTNLTKFKSDFSDEENRVHEKRNVSDEYKKLMSGNIDDCFRVGIGLAKKSLKIYTPFDEADILLCSPVGLRMIIGDEEGGSKRDFDCLSAIEVLIVDKAHVLFMQNWEHLANIFETLNVMPSKITTDISRVRHWALRDYSRYYRQTLVFSEVNFVEMHALLSRHCQNYAGEVSTVANPKSLLPEINVKIIQGMFRLAGDDPQTQSDERFQFFVTKILPKCEPHTLIFVSSYFDFVRLRNHMKRDGENFAQVHEYAKSGKVAKARNMFVNGQRKLMLLTERFHFYFRYRIKGIKSIVFYQLPVNPNFYTEITNFSRLYAEKLGDKSFRVETKILYSKFDVVRLQNIFGNSTARRLIKSEDEYLAMIGD